MKARAALIGTAVLAMLAACSERPQSLDPATTKRVDTPPWAVGENSAYTAPGWKGGDQAAWAQQIRQRGQAQNDYVR